MTGGAGSEFATARIVVGDGFVSLRRVARNAGANGDAIAVSFISSVAADFLFALAVFQFVARFAVVADSRFFVAV